MQEGDDLPTVEKLITQEQIERYAEASGDFNPVHVDHEFAAASQFGGTIAHGMLVAASISEMMTMAFGENWLVRGSLKLRFKAPVYPSEHISTFGRVKSVRERAGTREITCAVCVSKSDGEAAVAGDATVGIPV